MNKDIIKEITKFDIHCLTENDENKIISFTDIENMINSYFSIDKGDNEYPFYKFDLHIECDKYGIKYCNNDDIKQEEQMSMNGEDVIRKRVAREILSMIETVYFSDVFKEYRINNGSNGQRDLIMENIKSTYGIA